jgi:hypothetical protein
MKVSCWHDDWTNQHRGTGCTVERDAFLLFSTCLLCVKDHRPRAHRAENYRVVHVVLRRAVGLEELAH